MSAWTTWEIVRHQVAAWGHVRAADGSPVAGAEVTIAVIPEARRLG